jgi:hypothetical protein
MTTLEKGFQPTKQPTSQITYESVGKEKWNAIFKHFRVKNHQETDISATIFLTPTQKKATIGKDWRIMKVSSELWEELWGDDADLYPIPVYLKQTDDNGQLTNIHICTIGAEKVLSEQLGKMTNNLTERQLIVLLKHLTKQSESWGLGIQKFNETYPAKAIAVNPIISLLKSYTAVMNTLRTELIGEEGLIGYYRVTPGTLPHMNWVAHPDGQFWSSAPFRAIFKEHVLKEISKRTLNAVGLSMAYMPKLTVFNKLLTRYSVTFVKGVIE